MQFKSWFETDVKNWQNTINKFSANRDSPFKAWFPENNKVYLPFERVEINTEDEVVKFLKDVGYEIQDYKQGLIKDKHGRIVRLGKVLNKEEQEEIKKIKVKYDQQQISDVKYKDDIEGIKKYFSQLRSSYESSPQRVGINNQSPYMIVITNVPEDIAGMSTNRDWTSCMDLSGGENRKSIWCELKNGGFVAYLCYSNDANIDKPLARIHVRRFDNNKGKSIAILEDTIYGNSINGFKEEVQKWIDSKQGRIRPGRYVRQGGWYSDTFGSADPEDSIHKQQKDMRYLVLPNSDKKLWALLLKASKDKPEIYPGDIGIVNKTLEKLIKIPLSDDIKQKLIQFISDKAPHYRRRLIDKYPELTTEKEFEQLHLYTRANMLKSDPRHAEKHKEMVFQGIMSLDLNNPNLMINNKNKGYGKYESLAQVTDKLKIEGIKQLPVEIIRKMISISEEAIKKDPDNKEELMKNVVGSILHTFSMTNADIPEVVKFYQNLLPYWDALGQEYDFGNSINSLGKSATPFLPFLRKKLAEKEKVETDPRKTERLKYIIDSIESGKGFSSRYKY